MNFKYYELSTVYRLAWCAVKKYNCKIVKVYHGSGVETFENFFVEGAWDGEFNLGNFDESAFFMGSGANCKNQGKANVTFSTSSHTLERLYSISFNEDIYISNSLPLILYLSDSKLDSKYLNYETDFNSILKGLNEYTRKIPLNNGRILNLHYYCNIKLNSENKLLEIPKKEIKPFENYIEYEKRLMETLRNFINNAQSYYRKIKYGMVTTISKGYDAAACAALAKEVGCDTAVTFDKPEKYAEDCGKDIAETLGYKKIITKNANEYLNNSSLIEAEFLSSCELGTGIVFTAFENEFMNNVVFMGERGDKIWDKNRTDYNNNFQFTDEVFAGTSLIENRLRVGYIILPVPLYGASQWVSIHNISNSEEMKPYSIGGNYDRPIPRRILEDRGVPRSMFGMDKKGAGFNYRYDNLGRIKKRMSPESFERFNKFYKNNKRKGINIILHWLKFLWNTKEQYIRYFLNKIGLDVQFNKIGADAISNPGAPSYLFNWGIYELIKKLESENIKESLDENDSKIF